jgi:FlaA1/EpsC-like NDP-sugar epimerase
MKSKLSLLDRILELPRPAKRVVAVVADIILCVITVALAYRLRVDSWIFPTGNQWLSYAAAIVLSLPIFVRFGLYRAIFRYVGWGALNSVVRACALYGVIYAIIFSGIGVPLIPRTTGILQPILLFLGVGASRAIARYWLGGGYAAIMGKGQRRRVLIFGAGSAGRQLAAGLANSDDMQIAGFIDDDLLLHGSVMNGKHIYPPEKMVELIDDLGIADVLLAIPSASRQKRNEIIESLRGHPVSVRTLPGIFELADGKVTVNDLRPLDIEDLLGRDPVPPDPALMGKCITGKCVLVTGAGGSIGSELCRQIFALNPSMLVMVDNSEYNLYMIDQELNAPHGSDQRKRKCNSLLASVQDQKRMNEIFLEYRPETIYHAAAYKHVPLVEANPTEGIKNNVFGTRTVARLAEKHGVQDFVLISTDKAVRPPNIMGASKRIAEMVLQSMAATSSTTRFSMVRFGNVLGSSGSVVPLFRKQIASGGPVTVTHADVTRYFMTIAEAAQLVIQAGAMAKGGDVFVLDMGDPVKIIDLARRMIELSGLRIREAEAADGDIEIKVVGLRPAEKLYEELLLGDSPENTDHSRIMKAHDIAPEQDVLQAILKTLEAESANAHSTSLRSVIAELVPTI